MPEQKERFGPLRTWIAPALGIGLIAAGVAMGLGISSTYGPMIGAIVAALVMSVGQWRLTHPRVKVKQ